nr:hypothetical protein Q903MT_gene1964 [Picea sitchensis]
MHQTFHPHIEPILLRLYFDSRSLMLLRFPLRDFHLWFRYHISSISRWSYNPWSYIQIGSSCSALQLR